MGTKPDGSAWRIALRHPRRLDDVFAVLSLSEQAVATSGIISAISCGTANATAIFWTPEQDTRLRGLQCHRRGSHGVLSDALSTAAFVLGPEKGRALLESIPGVEGVFVDQDMQMTVTSGLEGLSASL